MPPPSKTSSGSKALIRLATLAPRAPAALRAEVDPFEPQPPALRGLTARVKRSFDPKGVLNKTDPDACCEVRKVRPLAPALEGFDAWITGRKRFHGGGRANLPVVEFAEGRFKINPLADWTHEHVEDYFKERNLPHHPLVADGYPSIGCWPCTKPVADGEDPRSGRWSGRDKTECGLHLS